MDYPDYSFPLWGIAGLARDSLLARHRSFREDARVCIDRLRPPLRIDGEKHIPQTGPCVLTVNHYHRQGFNAAWIALAVASSIPVEMHWIMTGELTYPGRWYAPIGRPLSRFALNRIARAYGFTNMPPMPPRPKDVEARAESVRTVLDFVRHAREPILGLAPEGGDSLHGKLARPAPGLGRFGLLLAGRGLKFSPVAVYESNGGLCLCFGPSYELAVPHGVPAGEKDCQAADVIMKNIAVLMPEALRGEFA
jgi:hypothetical protein